MMAVCGPHTVPRLTRVRRVRRGRTAIFIALLLTLASAAFAAENANPFPTKPVRLIVPFAPGGGVSAVARIVGPKLNEMWGQPVVIDNRPGANTMIGSEAVVKSAPDGYTLIIVSSAHVINHFLLQTPYHAVKDFAPVSSTSSGPYVMVVHPSVPANTLQEFLAYAKTRPGKLNYSTSGAGGVQHLAGELFNMMAGVSTQHIPYKGAGPAVIELLGGQVQYSFQPPGNVLAHVKSGKLKAIAVPLEARLAALPQVPTFAEAGMPGFIVKSWIGILAPARTLRPIIDKIAADVATILKMPDTRELLLRQEHDPMILGPDAFAAFIAKEMERVGRTVKTAHIKLDN